MKIAAKVDGKTYQSIGLGECAGSGEASIYEVPATELSVECERFDEAVAEGG